MTTYVVNAKGWGHVSTRVVEARDEDEAVEKVKRELGIEISVQPQERRPHPFLDGEAL